MPHIVGTVPKSHDLNDSAPSLLRRPANHNNLRSIDESECVSSPSLPPTVAGQNDCSRTVQSFSSVSFGEVASTGS